MRQELEDFIRYQETLGLSEQTIYHYRTRMRYFREYLQEMGIKELRDITIEHVRSYHDTLIARGIKMTTRHTYLSGIRAFFAWLHERGRLLSDLAERIELPKLDNPLPPTVLTEEEIALLLGVSNTDTVEGTRDHAILQIFYACGLRRGELIGLNIGDIDARKHTVFVRGKGNKERMVPIHDIALKAVADYLEVRSDSCHRGDPLFLTSRGIRVHVQIIQKLFRELSEALSRVVYPHLLRHTYAVHLLKGGADVRHVQILLGHESPNTTSRYLGLVKEDLKREYDRAMDGVLGE